MRGVGRDRRADMYARPVRDESWRYGRIHREGDRRQVVVLIVLADKVRVVRGDPKFMRAYAEVQGGNATGEGREGHAVPRCQRRQINGAKKAGRGRRFIDLPSLDAQPG